MSDDNSKKPESLQEKIARLEAERDARAQARAAERRAESAERYVAALEALAGHEEKHDGAVRLVKTDIGPVIVRGPTQVQYRNFKKALHLPDQRADAMRVMVTACVLFPTFDEFDAAVRVKPGVIDILADDVCELGGVIKDPKA